MAQRYPDGSLFHTLPSSVYASGHYVVASLCDGEYWEAGEHGRCGGEPAFGICGYCDVPGVPGKCLNCGATVHQMTDAERHARADLSRRIWAKRLKSAEVTALV